MNKEKIQTKVAQMNKSEWDKCKKGERFNVNIITKPKAKVTLEDIMSEIKTIKSDIKRIDARLTRVIQLNNLKE